MSIRLLWMLLLSLFLFGCSSTEEKTDEATVEDRGAATSDTQTYGADEGAGAGLSELDDPNSPLSKRIIYFEYDSSEILAQYRPTVEAHAAYLVKNPSVIVTLEGHADERGSREYNLALAERRAESVKRQMTLLGVTAGQIRTVSYGEERPAVDGHDESAWSQNRRVEFLY
jgi:peptidoglycan-associated lipoprotein